MAIKTKCLTPGAMFATHIDDESVALRVDYPRPFELTEDEAIQFEYHLHNAVELVVAQLFLRAEK